MFELASARRAANDFPQKSEPHARRNDKTRQLAMNVESVKTFKDFESIPDFIRCSLNREPSCTSVFKV